MIKPDSFDEQLHAQFAQLRREDSQSAPGFAAMRAAADVVVPSASSTAESTDARVRPVNVARRVLLMGTPLLVAAALLLMLRPNSERAADQEFDALVTEWSRASEATFRSPTDRLLNVPGSEYLRGTPRIGTGIGAGNPS